MSHFVYDDTALFFPKTNLNPIPAGGDPTKFVADIDWNTLNQAVVDIKDVLRGAEWIGFEPQASDPAPTGVDDYLWLDTSDTLFLHVGGGGGSDIDLTAGGGGGEANTASNVNVGGVGVFKQKVGVDLEFKGINAGSSKISVVDEVGNNEIDIDVVEANVVHDNLSGSGTNSHADIDTHIGLFEGEALGTIWYSDGSVATTLAPGTSGQFLKTLGAGNSPIWADGSIIVQDEGSPVTNTPHTTLNFVGAGVTATDGGGGVSTITITAGAGGNTLDQAYDQGGAGAGRTITADAGAVQILNTGLEISQTASASGVPATALLIDIASHLDITASTEWRAIDFDWRAFTLDWDTGDFAEQSLIFIDPPAIDATAASTIDVAAVLRIDGAMPLGTFMTATENYTLYLGDAMKIAHQTGAGATTEKGLWIAHDGLVLNNQADSPMFTMSGSVNKTGELGGVANQYGFGMQVATDDGTTPSSHELVWYSQIDTTLSDSGWGSKIMRLASDGALTAFQHISQRDAIGEVITEAGALGMKLVNDTLATVSVNQYSPLLLFQGRYWDAGEGGGSEEEEFQMGLQLVPGHDTTLNAEQGSLVFLSDNDEAGIAIVAHVTDQGDFVGRRVEGESAIFGAASATHVANTVKSNRFVADSLLQTFQITSDGASPSTLLGLEVQSAPHTNLSDGNAIYVDFDIDSFINFVDVTTDQTAVIVRAPTYTSDDGGGDTIARASTWRITGAPGAGTNVTITRPYALDVDTGASKLGVGIVMDESAAAPVTAVAGEGVWWVRNTSPSQPVFTDDTGVDHTLGVQVAGQATATGTTTTASGTDVLISGMTITPGAGNYLVFFSTSLSHSANGSTINISIYVGGVQVAHTERDWARGINSITQPSGTQAYITGVTGGQAIEARWRTSGATASAFERTLTVVEAL